MKMHPLIPGCLLFSAALLVGAIPVHAEGMKGRLGIGGFGAQAVPLGVQELRDRGDVGTDAGATLRYGLKEKLAVGVSYDNIYLDNGIRREPLTLSALYYFNPNKRWTPVTEFGIGGASSESGGPFTNFSIKAGISAEVFLTRMFSIGPQLNFHYITATGHAPYRAIVMSPGLVAMLYFGGDKGAAKEKTQAPPPAVSATMLAIAPAQVTLSSGQSQAFQANMSDKSNAGVRWSINPPLGSISDSGVYQAPATVSFAQTVQVTATSMADPSKSATSMIQLSPAGPAQEVSIRLEILFDPKKDDIKPAYDQELKKLADFLKSYPSTSAQIEGHTDNQGEAAYNKGLSQRRADSVKKALVTRFSVDASRLTAVGFGLEKPISDNTTTQGRAQNRRVVAVVKTIAQP